MKSTFIPYWSPIQISPPAPIVAAGSSLYRTGEPWATAKIQWQDMDKMWTVVGKQGSVKIEDENRHWMCKDKNHRYYVGFSRVASFKGAMKFCSSFGGRLPTPNG